ncbi:MAG: chromophore lyase CpcT/CpeT [Pseudomonadota bacterium]
MGTCIATTTRRAKRWLTLIVLTALCASATAQERSYTLLERELEYLMELWPGDYDNREQVQFDFNVGKRSPAQGGHKRVHSQIRRVDLPTFGEHVLYAKTFGDNNSDNVIRHHLYELKADETAKAIRIRVHQFKNGGRYSGAAANPAILDSMTRDDTTVAAGCDLLLTRDVDAIVGGTAPGACAAASENGGESLDYQVRISETGYWFHDRKITNDSSAEPQLPWYQLERVRWFQCMLDFPREDGGRPVNTVSYVRIHDQGGTYPFTYRDGRDMVFTFRNTWSYGMQRETLVIVIQEGDETGKTLVYGWAEPGSDRIGVNPGWIRLQCDLDTPKKRKFQQWLRPDS